MDCIEISNVCSGPCCKTTPFADLKLSLIVYGQWSHIWGAFFDKILLYSARAEYRTKVSQMGVAFYYYSLTIVCPWESFD